MLRHLERRPQKQRCVRRCKRRSGCHHSLAFLHGMHALCNTWNESKPLNGVLLHVREPHRLPQNKHRELPDIKMMACSLRRWCTQCSVHRLSLRCWCTQCSVHRLSLRCWCTQCKVHRLALRCWCTQCNIHPLALRWWLACHFKSCRGAIRSKKPGISKSQIF